MPTEYEQELDSDIKKALAIGGDMPAIERKPINPDVFAAPYAGFVKRADTAPDATEPAHRNPNIAEAIKSRAEAALAAADPVKQANGYEELERIVKLAYQQSASGKGKQRHSLGPVGFRPWHEQPILVNARQVGPGGPALQVMKKTQESVTMAGNKDFVAAKAEALGAIVYAAALYKLYEEMEAVNG